MNPVSKHPRPYHREAVFGPGRRRKLCAEARRLYRMRIRVARRERRITPNDVLLAEELVKRLGWDGQLDPSHQTLAHAVGCDIRTVGRAMDRLRSMGMIDWQQRLKRDGHAVRQDSNAYVLLPDGRPLPMRLMPRRPCISTDRQAAREVPTSFYSDAPEAAAAQRSLGEIRAAREAAQRLRWQSERARRLGLPVPA